ncbi:hydroxyethylthiazole kinase-like [Triticum dicoccoides]|uniref:Hydroxyethylthiazole kinase n=1 Tax=Triticum aestivum TaxID=4565 RepID=A0A3B6EPF3_WHEAT|nr:hydroxyethylthiazole kinase-like [Triticum dicoccoides]XP_044343041.1 hydroxyethylthiazole kinase-like [Triticum aestivum]
MDEERTEAWWGRRAWALLSAVRERAPLVQCITNLVSMDIAANALTAAGASPAMLHCLREIPDFTPRCDAVYINVGTLSEDWLPSMRAAASAGRPWVLDPVAVAASGFRMEACLQLLALRPAVVRGNASEILALASSSDSSSSSFKGVDSSHDSGEALQASKALARSSGAVVAVSGAVDFITDGEQVVSASNGVALMQKITATGCAVTALIAAFVGADPSDALAATACALAIFGLAGEIGMESAKGPASLRMHLIDALYGLDEQTVTSGVKIALVL